MDFSDSIEERTFRTGLQEWIKAQLPFTEEPADGDARVTFLAEWQSRLFDGGWAAVSFPEEYGGRGLGPTFEAIVVDELAAAGLPSPWHYGYVARVILLYGSEEQRDRFLLPAFRGDERWCQGFSEPDAGSDLASLTTRAERDGDDYVITGQKVWTSQAHWAQWCLLLARSNRDAANHQALSCFLVPMDTPGITVRPFRQANGSLEFAEVFLDQVRVPANLLVGNEGDGWRIAMSTVSLERGPADAGMISDLRRNLGALARSQAVRLRNDGDMTSSLVRAFVDVEVLRVHVLRSLSARARGLGSEFDVSVDKLLLIRAEQELAHATMDLYGAAPILGSRPDVLAQYFWSRSASVYGGSQEIQRTIVATRLLGLPRS